MAQNQNYKGNNRNNNNNRNRNNNNRNRNNNRNNNRSQPQKPQQQNEQQPKQEASKASTKKSVDPMTDLLWFFVVLFLISGGFLFNKYYLGPRRPGIYNSNYESPPFRKEAELKFLDGEANRNIIDIDIELADTQREITMGLKNRKFLPANGGMLFVFGDARLRTFNMESVFVSLDMLFIDTDQEIIRISKNTHPRSPASIPSGGKAKYVLQVQGGFCDAFNIRVGDHVEFWRKGRPLLF